MAAWIHNLVTPLHLIYTQQTLTFNLFEINIFIVISNLNSPSTMVAKKYTQHNEEVETHQREDSKIARQRKKVKYKENSIHFKHITNQE